MYYLDRKLVCERLRLGQSQSYRMIEPSRLSYIASSDVVDLLNDSRRANERMVREIPTDIVTAKELETHTGIPLRKIMLMAHGHRLPHWRLNQKTTRFRLSTVDEWLRSESRRPCRVR